MRVGGELRDLRLVEVNHIHKIRNAVRDADTHQLHKLYDNTFSHLRTRLSVEDSYKHLSTYTKIADTMIASTNGTFVKTYKSDYVGLAQKEREKWMQSTSTAQYLGNTN